MLTMINTYFRHFIRNDKGATAIEYGLIAAGIAVAIIAAVYSLGGELTSMFTGITSDLKSRGA